MGRNNRGTHSFEPAYALFQSKERHSNNAHLQIDSTEEWLQFPVAFVGTFLIHYYFLFEEVYPVTDMVLTLVAFSFFWIILKETC